MKIIRYLFAIALACGAASVAKADAVDFRMNVLDPNFSRVNISSQPFAVTFGTCDFNFLPSGITPTPEGCFYGKNVSNQTWTSLTFFFPKVGAIAGQTANCAPQANANIFSAAQCGTTGNQFFLVFTGGSIPNSGPGSEFVIVESGAPPYDPNNPNSFPIGTLTFNAVPEPSSILLLSTGTLIVGLFLLKRRNASGLSAL
jgi:hypothetical protein